MKKKQLNEKQIKAEIAYINKEVIHLRNIIDNYERLISTAEDNKFKLLQKRDDLEHKLAKLQGLTVI